jgi:hypothetical protein
MPVDCQLFGGLNQNDALIWINQDIMLYHSTALMMSVAPDGA